MRCIDCEFWRNIDEVDGYCELRNIITPLNFICKWMDTLKEVKHWSMNSLNQSEENKGKL